MISVLLPSRGRPGPLGESVASLMTLAADPSAVEVLIAADPDDPETAARDWTAERAAGWAVESWTAPERYGYMGLHRYYNHLAGVMAKGGWLLLWNDDARMLTKAWDEAVHGQQPGVLWLTANHAPGGNFFPAFPAAWAKAWGHVSLSPNNDVWVSEIGARTGRQWHIPVEVFHDRFDVTGGHDDQTYAEGRAVMGTYSNHPDYDSPANREARIRDAIAVRRLAEP